MLMMWFYSVDRVDGVIAMTLLKRSLRRISESPTTIYFLYVCNKFLRGHFTHGSRSPHRDLKTKKHRGKNNHGELSLRRSRNSNLQHQWIIQQNHQPQAQVNSK